MQLLSLVCPHCEASLASGPERRVFVCEGCGTSSVVAAGSEALWAFPRRLARPQLPVPETGRIVLLPLWVLPLETEAMGVWSKRMPKEIRLPAVGVGAMSRLILYGENLTRAPGPLEEIDEIIDATARRRLSPAELGLEDAYATAEILALAHVEGWPPDPDVDDLEIPFGPIRMVDLPCHHRSGSLTDLVFGLAVSDNVLRFTELPDQREVLARSLAHRS